MHSHYIARLSDTLYSFYHRPEEGIYCRAYRQGRWMPEESVLKDARESFSVTVSTKEKVLYVFCQNAAGDIVLCLFQNGNWNTRIMLKNQSRRIYTIVIQPVPTAADMAILYNSVGEDGKTNSLMSRRLVSGHWGEASMIDRFSSVGGMFFQSQQIENGHMLLLYMTKTPDNTLGYREVTTDRYGEFHAVHSGSYPLAECSYLTTGDAIHVFYIVRTLLSSQLLYRKKEDAQFSPPVVIYEAQRLENCLPAFINGRLCVYYMANGRLYVSTSDNRGDSFDKPAKYQNKFCLNPVKAVYVSDEAQDTADHFVREVYVDTMRPWDIQILPEACESFWGMRARPGIAAAAKESGRAVNRDEEIKPVAEGRVEAASVQAVPAASGHEGQMRNAFAEFGAPPPDNPRDLAALGKKEGRGQSLDARSCAAPEGVSRIQNQLMEMRKALNEKDAQLIQLSGLLRNRSDELTELELEKRQMLRSQAVEIDRLRELAARHEKSRKGWKERQRELTDKITRLEKENDDLRQRAQRRVDEQPRLEETAAPIIATQSLAAGGQTAGEDGPPAHTARQHTPGTAILVIPQPDTAFE